MGLDDLINQFRNEPSFEERIKLISSIKEELAKSPNYPWTCECGTNNAAGWPSCNFCFKDKPKV